MHTNVNIQHQPSFYVNTNHNSNSNNAMTNNQKIDNFDNENYAFSDDEAESVELNKKIYISGQKMDLSFPKVNDLVIQTCVSYTTRLFLI
jgi:hypothetical protein